MTSRMLSSLRVASIVLSLSLTLAEVVSSSAVAATAPIAVTRQVEQIFAPERVLAAALAPDGRHVAFAVREGRGLEILIHDVDQKERTSRVRVDARMGTQLAFFQWSAANRLILVPEAPLILEVELGARTARVVTDEKALAILAEKRRSGRPSIRVLGLQRDQETATVEVRWSSGDGEAVVDVVSVELRTGNLKRGHTTRVDASIGRLLADQQGRPRLAYDRHGRGRRYLYLPTDGGPRDWESLDRVFGRGRAARFEVSAQDFFGERAVPLGFGEDAHEMYFATNEDRDTFGICRLDLATGEQEALVMEARGGDLVDTSVAFPEDVLIRDRARREVVGVHGTGADAMTFWWDDELAGVQAGVEEKFPGRRVRLLEWDDARTRFLVVVAAGHDPGRYFVFHRAEGRSVEYLRQGSLNAADAPRVEALVVNRPDESGGPVRARITWPHAKTPTTQPPLIVWLHDAPAQRVTSGWQRETQAWAAMGFVVLEVDYRGTRGLGRAAIDAVRAGYDRVPLAEVLAVVAALQARDAFDSARVAVVGDGFGGYLALRALQLHPETFRTAAVINAAVDLADFFRSERDAEAFRRSAEQAFSATSAAHSSFTNVTAGDGGGDSVIPGGVDTGGGGGAPGGRGAPSLSAGGGGPAPTFERECVRWFFSGDGRQKIAVNDDLEALTQPVLLAHDPRLSSPGIGPMQRLRDTLTRRQQVVEWLDMSETSASDGLPSRGEVVWRIGEFLRVHLNATTTPTGGNK